MTRPSGAGKPAPSELLPELLELVDGAGRAILEIYERSRGPEVVLKEDRSPLTEADLASHRHLTTGLAQLTPSVPVFSEESRAVPWEERRRWETFWLVDPLDGTKEFLHRNDQFTVNVAWIEQGRPTFGLVGIPVDGEIYVGGPGGAFRYAGPDGAPERLEIGRWDGERPLRVATSRSHSGPTTDTFLERLGPHERVPLGSSLKLCRLAAGEIDLYPRLGPIMEWDIAAAHAVLEAAGGTIRSFEGEPLAYNSEELRLPWFIARRPGVPLPELAGLR